MQAVMNDPKFLVAHAKLESCCSSKAAFRNVWSESI